MGGRPWHHREIETLQRMWPLQPFNDIQAALPGRSRNAINNMAAHRKIGRFPEARRENGGACPRLPLVIVELRRARERQNMTLEELAKRIGVERVSLQKWESLWHRPRFQMLLDWAEALGYEIALRQTKFGKRSPAPTGG